MADDSLNKRFPNCEVIPLGGGGIAKREPEDIAKGEHIEIRMNSKSIFD